MHYKQQSFSRMLILSFSHFANCYHCCGFHHLYAWICVYMRICRCYIADNLLVCMHFSFSLSFLFLFFICRAGFIYGSVYSMHQHFKVDICVNILLHHCISHISNQNSLALRFICQIVYICRMNQALLPPLLLLILPAFTSIYPFQIERNTFTPKQIIVEIIYQVQHAKSIPYIVLVYVLYTSVSFLEFVSKCYSHVLTSLTHSFFVFAFPFHSTK